MTLGSYFENINERLDEAQRNLREEIGALRARVAVSDWVDARTIETDIRTFRSKSSRLLDELQSRCDRIFEEAKSKLLDRDVHFVRALSKKEEQLAVVRGERDKAKDQLKNSRASLQRHMQQLNRCKSDCKAMRERDLVLQRENSALKRDLKDCREFLNAMKPK